MVTNHGGIGLAAKNATQEELALGFLTHAYAIMISGSSNPVFVILKIDEKRRVYKIVFGSPANSERHSVGDEGWLDHPVPKTAPLKVIEDGERLVIDNAEEDERVAYMLPHILQKGIKAVCYEPIILKGKTKYIVAFDLVDNDLDGFTQRRLGLLDQYSSIVYSTIVPQLLNGQGGKHKSLPNYMVALSEMRHKVLNPVTMIGGFIVVAKKRVEESIGLATAISQCIREGKLREAEELCVEVREKDQKALERLDFAIEDARKIEKNMSQLSSLFNFLHQMKTDQESASPVHEEIDDERLALFDINLHEDARDLPVYPRLIPEILIQLENCIKLHLDDVNSLSTTIARNNGNIIISISSREFFPNAVLHDDSIDVLSTGLQACGGMTNCLPKKIVVHVPHLAH